MKQVKEKYQEFIDTCIELLRERMGEGYNIQINTILKNNSITMDGVVIIKNGTRITPNIYLEEYYQMYEEGESVDTITERILQVYHAKLHEKDDFQITFTYEAMKESIIFRLVNKEKNKELLESCPYKDFLDFAITFHCLVQEEAESIGTIRITNEHLKQWKIDVDAIYQQAMLNTPKLLPPLLRKMEDVLHDILADEGIELEEEQIKLLNHSTKENEDDTAQMYVLSNVKGINGASCLLYPQVIKNFSKLLQCDIYILPSSIHEVILLPAQSTYSSKMLSDMVLDINQTQVPYEEILSNHVYYYSSIQNEIKILL